MKRILLLALLLLMIFPWQTAATDLTPEQERINGIQNAMKSTVRITPEFGTTGSGFFVGKNHVITNVHVVIFPGVKGDYQVEKPDGTFCKGKLAYHEEALDLALLKVDCDGEPLELAQHVSVGQDVFITGNPRTMDFIASSGIVAKIVTKKKMYPFIISDIFGEEGSSGSPLIDSRGKVVGVVMALQINARHLIYSIHLKDVGAFLKRAGVQNGNSSLEL